MSDTCSFSIKYECEDSSFSGSSTSNFIQDEEQFDANHSDSLTQIKTTDGKETSIYLSTGNKLLFTSGKYYYIDHTIAYTEYQKECTGIVGICHTCGGKIKGSLKVSSNFICHLKTKHPDIYQDFIRRKNDYTATSIKLSKKNHNNRTTLCPSITDTQNSEKQQQFHHKILLFLITTNLSFDTVQRPAFLELFSYADIAIEIHPSNYYEKLVKDTCDYKRMELFQIFNASTLYFCCTLDVWNYNGFYYIAISAHWIDDQLRRQSALLACKKCVENLACLENLHHLYSAAMTQYGIAPTQIVACTTLNMQNYFDDFGELNLGKDVFQDTCNPQLNDVAEKLTFLSNPDAFHVNAFMLDIIKLNKIWGGNFFRKLNSCGKSLHSSSMEKCCNIWRIHMSKEQTDVVMSFLGEPLVKPCLYSVTSLYAAIKQLLNSKEQLKDISNCLNVPCLSNQETDYLQEFLLVYEPMAMAFEFLDMTQNHYYGCFLPTLVTIKWKLIRLYNSKKLCHLQDALQQLREDLQMDFKDYYNLDESKSDSIMAALTYPPVKTRFLSGLKDNIYCLSFHPRNMLLKYGKEYHKRDDNFHNQYTSLGNISSAECEVNEFFDFGDSTDSVDAEELRDVNISKKEIAELMTELLSNLNEGIPFDSIELETPRKFILNYQEEQQNTTPNTSPEKISENAECVSRQLQFEEQASIQEPPQQPQESMPESCSIISSNNVTQQNMSFHPDVMSTPSTTHNGQNIVEQSQENDETLAMIPVATPKKNADNSPSNTVSIPANNISTQVDVIAVPIPGQPNCFQLARVVNSTDELMESGTKVITGSKFLKEKSKGTAARYDVPYETNYSGEYISIKRHAIAEYIDKFESLKHAQVNQISSTTTDSETPSDKEFTKYQYDLMQQQMRIHVQMLTQTYIQVYCHPELWKLASKPKEMLLELQQKSQDNANFKIWNLEKAINLINKWSHDLDQDTEENRALMQFLHREVELTNHNTRQIPRFHPRLLDCFLESDVFMYPEYLPRMPFTPKVLTIEHFSPVECYLIAMGLEKHVNLIRQRKERIFKKSSAERLACKRFTKDLLPGKNHRRVWDHIVQMRNAEYYNPIKYYFEHQRAPPVEYTPIIGFENNTVPLPKDRFSELPLVFQQYLQKKNAPPAPPKPKRKPKNPNVTVSDKFRNSFFEFVREAVGEDILTEEENIDETPVQTHPCESQTLSENNTPTTRKRNLPVNDAPKAKRRRLPHSLTINVNYVFGSPPASNLPSILPNTSSVAGLNNTTLLSSANNTSTGSLLDTTSTNTNADHINRSCNTNSSALDVPVVTYNFDVTTKTLQPQYGQISTTFSHQSADINTASIDTVTISSDDSMQGINHAADTTALTQATEDNSQIPAPENSSTGTGHAEPTQSTTTTIDRSPEANNSTVTTSGDPAQSATSTTPINPTTAKRPQGSKRDTTSNAERDRSSDASQLITSVTTLSNVNSVSTTDTSNRQPQQKDLAIVSKNSQPNALKFSDGNKENLNTTLKTKQQCGKYRRRTVILSHITKLNRSITRKSVAYREKRSIKQRCEDLITAYGLHLETLQVRHKHSPIVQHFYRRFKALELYTDLLKGLKMICNKSASNNNGGNSSPSGLKRSRNSNAEDESSPSTQRMARKINRQEENFRHMLLPDTPEEANRKDAIYAFNFYEKVEEAFRASNRADDCKKFNTILKTFDPKKDKVSDLYYKLERLFLPDHPELAQVFLTFLLPSEAAEIGKFFEHFMITNMTTFINKLNIYFNKQPAQIRKIYNCLNELADDPDVTMKKIESKIIPLLKGNQFLIDWFMQQFPKSTPPERLFSTPEHILNVKEQQSNRPGEHVETITDMDSTVNDTQSQAPTCQLRYINGRIFYGSKMLLPAKLSFMAVSYKDNRTSTPPAQPSQTQITGCVHAIKDHGEKRLQSTSELANVAANTESTDEQDKSEEDDVSKVLVIDTTAEEDDSCSSFEPCDENTLKAHALRLNPSYYGSTCYSSSATSTPNLNSNFQGHHPNAKKVSLNFNEEASTAGNTPATGKTSPRKNQGHQSLNSPSSSATSCQSHANVREKRKSPSKKTKSPLIQGTGRAVRSFGNQPMVVIHENNSAIQCAKRLKSMVETPSDEQNLNEDTVVDTKEHINIVARTKTSMKSSSSVANSGAVTSTTTTPSSTFIPNANTNVKQEHSDDLEFLPEHASITRSPFPTLKMDTDSNEEDAAPARNASASNICSDEDCKIDIVANLVTEPTEDTNEIPRPVPLPLNAAWTRDEDKVILIEMKLGSTNREELYRRIATKLPRRTLFEITARHQFLVDFLAKLQGK